MLNGLEPKGTKSMTTSIAFKSTWMAFLSVYVLFSTVLIIFNMCELGIVALKSNLKIPYT